MHKLLSELDKVWCARTITKEEENWLAESFTMFLERSLNQIRKHRELYPALHPPSLVRYEISLYKYCNTVDYISVQLPTRIKLIVFINPLANNVPLK